MKSKRPPGFPAWLLNILGSSRNNDAVLGDLEERYQVRQRPLWYWGQAFAAIWASFANEVLEHKRQSFAAIVCGWSVLLSIWFAVEFMFGNPIAWTRHVCVFVWFIGGSCSGSVVAFWSKRQGGQGRSSVLLYSSSILLFLLGLHGRPSKLHLVDFWIDVAVLTFSVLFAGLWVDSVAWSEEALQKERV